MYGNLDCKREKLKHNDYFKKKKKVCRLELAVLAMFDVSTGWRVHSGDVCQNSFKVCRLELANSLYTSCISIKI
jgi:hypothetical protein